MHRTRVPTSGDIPERWPGDPLLSSHTKDEPVPGFVQCRCCSTLGSSHERLACARAV
jgi:hypothetical protein